MSETHQCLGDESILVGSTVLPRVLSRKDNSNHEWQHLSCCLLEQTRGDDFPSTESTSSSDHESSETKGLTDRQIHPREEKCCGGHFEQVGPDSENRMVLGTTSGEQTVQVVGGLHTRFVCNIKESQTTPVLLSSLRQESHSARSIPTSAGASSPTV